MKKVDRQEWTPADDAALRKHRAAGLSYSAIALRMKRTKLQVEGRFRRLAAGVTAMRVSDNEERQRIIDLARQGLSDGQIAKQTGWSPSTVRTVRRRAGVAALARGGAGRVVTAADREQMRQMRLDGKTVLEIAAELGWSEDAIRKHTVGCVPRVPRPRPQRSRATALTEEKRRRIMDARGSGLTQTAVAAAEGVSPATVSRLWLQAEEEFGPPPPAVEAQWAALLGGERTDAFRDALAFDAGRGKVGRVVVETGMGRSSMAYA